MRTSHRWFHWLCALEGIFALAVLLRIPSEGGSLSPARLAMMGVIIAFILLFGFLGFRPARILDDLARPGIIWTTALLSILFSLILFLLRYLDPQGSLLPSLYARLAPLLWYFLLLSIQHTIYLLYLKNGLRADRLKLEQGVAAASLTSFCILLFVLLIVSITKLGITKDEAYWGEPGVPLLGWQLLLALLIGLAILVLHILVPRAAGSPRLDGLLPVSIWLVASIVWLNVPITTLRNSFYAPITPPYATPFPYSDAGYYDYASQSLLIGTDYLGGIPPRPLYVTFLAALHFLFGQDYVAIIAAQTLVLALFPVALYFLGSRLHSPAAGVTIAFFAVFRELTTLWISSNTRTASTKMFITDFAAATGIAFACLAAIRWLERRDTRSALIAGGSFGLLLLLRTQSLIILPVLFLVAFFAYQKNIREWIRAGVMFGLAMTLTITPWLVHNYTVTGAFAFDDPAQMAVIYSQYSFSENLDISKFDFESESLGSRLITFTLENPGFVAGFIANHFLNTEIGGLLSLPLIEPFNGLLATVNLYWIEWNGSLAWYNLALLVLYLAIIGLGLGAAWARWKWIGLVPLAFNIGYVLANGISRFSSWRYNLPVDWVVYYYFGLGAVEIMLRAARLFGASHSGIREPDPGISKDDSSVLTTRHILPVAVFVLIGSLPWLAKGLAPPRYTSTAHELKLQVAAHGLESAALDQFLAQKNATLLEGRALYPRFFLRNDGIFSKTPWPVYQAREYARMGFLLLNESVHNVVLASDKPLLIPHGSDAIILGCQRDGYIEARWTFFVESGDNFGSESGLSPCIP